MIRILAYGLLVCFASSCNAAEATAAKDAQALADRLTGNDKQAASNNPQCKLFTPAEVAEYIGSSVVSGKNAVSGLGCQWVAQAGSGDVIVAVVPEEYFEVPSLAIGFKELAEIGTNAFVVPELGGWAAGALNGKEGVRVSVAGSKASEASAIALLKEALKRHRS